MSQYNVNDAMFSDDFCFLMLVLDLKESFVQQPLS